MKRLLALFTVLCLLVGLCACQTKTAEKTDVAEPLTWDKINSIPIASDDMTEEQLRQICLDFLHTTLRFAWTPSQDTDFTPKGEVIKTFQTGSVYGGIPYITGRVGNIYTVMEYYNEENGMLDLSGGMDTIAAFANQCSGSVFWAWNRVCSSVKYNNTTDMVMGNGCLRVGPYTYPDGIFDFIAQGEPTDKICADNGEQTMYESYALVKPADGIVTAYSANSHVRMVSGAPTVIRDSDGQIDGENSYLTYSDQDGNFYETLQSNNIPYEYVGGYQVKISFKKLFEGAYIPFTFAELNKQKAVDKSETQFNYSGESIALYNLLTGKVTSNYSISDITVVIKDAKGKQVYRTMHPTYNYTGMQVPEYSLDRVIVPMEINPFTDGTHTIEISARIGTGEKPVVYCGILTA